MVEGVITLELTLEEARALLEVLGDAKGEMLERVYGKVVEATWEVEGPVAE